jgi:hypothetical protein
MEDNYLITDDEWLIFKPEFNEPLDNYYDVINKYPKIIFSEPEISIIDKTENYNTKYIVHNRFNKNIDLTNNINLTYLYLGHSFNFKLDLSNNINLTQLIFGYCFNQEIDLSKNINLEKLI